MKKLLSVTIGIPAYNEEANIGNLIDNLLKQDKKNYMLKQIIIISDASTDKTDNIVKSFGNKKIRLITNKIRKGQVYSQNLIFSISNSDLVVIMEADTLPEDKKFLSKLFSSVIRDQSIGLVQSNIKPKHTGALLEKVLYHQVSIYLKFVVSNPQTKQWLCTGRGGRAFTKKVYKRLIWPSNVPEDIFAYLWCKQHNLKIDFQNSAISIYKLPKNFEDFVKERQKIASGQQTLKKYFSESLFLNIYEKPKLLKLKMFTYFLFNNPLFCFFYIYLNLRLKSKISDIKFTDLWPNTLSTKKILVR